MTNFIVIKCNYLIILGLHINTGHSISTFVSFVKTFVFLCGQWILILPRRITKYSTKGHKGIIC
jgi:hypothetical protein